ncbi:MAG: hypothetical protein U0570_01420 [Phycisphaerales bacterium]
MRQRWMLAWAVAGLAAGAAGAPTAAIPFERVPPSPTIAPRRAATIEAVAFGFSGYVPSDAWSPVRVHISGNPEIRSGAFAGTLSIEFEQDATQSGQITTAISTTPGRITPVDLVAAIPSSYSNITLELRDERGSLVHSRRYARINNLGEPTPGEWVDEAAMVVAVADKSGLVPSFSRVVEDPGSVQRLLAEARTKNEEEKTSRLASVVVAADDLPQIAEAYEGLMGLVVNSDALGGMPAGQTAAIGRWVRSGGTLIVPLGSDAQSWRKLFAAAELPVQVLEPRAVTPGADLRPFFGPQSEPITGRVLTLPETAAAWKLRWTPEGVTRHDGKPLEGLLAEGPCGFGWVVVLGLEPGAVAGESKRLSKLWTSAIGGTRFATVHGQAEQDWYAQSSGPTEENRKAIRAVLNSQVEVPPVGDGLFLAIAALMVALAAAIGPVDAIILRRANRRSWSWMTALGWIGGASILAAAAPPLIRTAKSTFGRLRVVDVLAGETPLAESTALSSLFSDAPTDLQIRGTGQEPEPLNGWFRGVSGLWRNKFENSSPLMTFATAQLDVRLPGGESRRSSVPLEPVVLSQWTLRSFMDRSSQNEVPKVEWSSGPEGLVATIHGLPATPTQIGIQLGETVFDATFTMAGKDCRAVVGTNLAKNNWWTGDPGAFNIEFRRVEDVPPRLLFDVPGADARTHAIDRYTASGAWGCVYVLVPQSTPTLRAFNPSGRELTPHEAAVWRIVAPVPRDWRAAPREAGDKADQHAEEKDP